MMTLAATLSTGFAALGLWIFFFWLYRDYRIDKVRQDLFRLRDEIWDICAQQQILDRPAHRVLRSRLNGMIRFAHRLTFTWWVTAVTVECFHPTPEIDERHRREVEQALESIETDVADALRSRLSRAHVLMIEHLALVSPVFWVCIIPAVLIAVIGFAWSGWAALLDRIPRGDLVDRQSAVLGT